MDFFGIGTALKGCARVYFRSARATGRTSRLVSSLKEGDRVIFANQTEADRVEHICRVHGKKIKVTVVDPNNPYRALDLRPGVESTFFDHSWVEQFYFNRIDEACKNLSSMEKHLSRNDDQDKETESQRMEKIRWES